MACTVTARIHPQAIEVADELDWHAWKMFTGASVSQVLPRPCTRAVPHGHLPSHEVPPQSMFIESAPSKNSEAFASEGGLSVRHPATLPWRDAFSLALDMPVSEESHRVRLRQRRSGSWQQISRRKFRPSRVQGWLLRARVPSKAEQLASEAALAYRPGEPDVKEEMDDPEASMEAEFEAVRAGFLNRYRSVISAAHLGEVSPAPIHRDVMERFLDTIRRYGQDPLVLGYHGTPERNLSSIFEHGLLVPGRCPGSRVRVANGSAHGLGIYLAEEGAHALSATFLKGSAKMLICGVVDTTLLPSLDERPLESESERSVPVHRRPSFVCRGRQVAHRIHRPTVAKLQKRQAVKAAQVQHTRRFIGRQVLGAENEHLRHAGNAMVVFRRAHVAPLFVADGTAGGRVEPQGEAYTRWGRCGAGARSNRQGQPAMVGTRRCWDGNLGEAVWVTVPAEASRHATALKRRFVRRLRDVQRAACRDEKQGAAF
mmetsp:Transcript_122456/g.305756  ORF Transcript_122456/g.305756 Transcript_122456/m.305756 type:complete len:485 (-) Transcript_122456:226-1680(-)|eukprot:CAMPEP_0115208630 /NCGR_PEP_ID=MMETSP0270-20121206/21323_1 /TAXON_ID=71861 /ORGANISM="Scrippsiella trochoidea, Strain CCMP3099" /LENGTH=484 /DNA_ID=CAMNT_0002622245 /DNA_START=81 /DNA_END=1535 /DNA_ORIENTATION=+